MLAMPAIATAQERSGVQGRIVARGGEGLAEAPVIVEGAGEVRSSVADEEGRFRLELSPGEYRVWSYYDLHHGARLDAVRVTRGKFAYVRLVLDPITVDDSGVEEVEVAYRADTTSEAAQLAIRRESASVQDAVSAKEISRSGDSSAAAAAKRVVGVTIDADDQLIVRGLGGRYNRVLLNGVSVPSMDPGSVSVGLGLFPTSILDSLAVVKTFSPDLPGDFAGGTLLIDSSKYPEERSITLGLSLGMNTLSTFRERPDYRGGSRDWLAFDDGTRALPSTVPPEQITCCAPGPGAAFTRDEVTEMARGFPNVWNLQRRTSLPKMGFDFGVGNSTSFGKDKRFGYRLAFGYDYAELRRTGTIRRNRVDPTSPSGVTPLGELAFENGEMSAEWGGLVTAGLGLGKHHDINLVSLFHREADDRTSTQEGDIAGMRSRRWQLEYVERMLSVNQLVGEHRNFGGSKARLRWNVFGGMASRNTPDMRLINYSNFGGDELIWAETTTSGGRFYDTFSKVDYGIDTNVRFPLWQSAWATTGVRIRRTTAEFEMRRFRYRKGSNVSDPAEYGEEPESIFAPDRIGSPSDPNTLTWFAESTNPTDGYRGAQSLYAAFAMVETPVVSSLKLSGGVRTEFFSQAVDARSPFPGAQVDETLSSDRSDVDVMPGLTFTYGIPRKGKEPNMILRAGYGMTVARPQFRELAPFQFYDFQLDRLIVGNPELERTRIQNADLRCEWYVGALDLVSISLFYKHFDKPIELQIRDPESLTSRFINADTARAYGAEVEARFGLAHVHRALKFFSLNGNVALMRSRVFLPEELSGAVRSDRPLFNQSPYVTNLSLRFDHPDSGVAASLVYNVYGPRITDVGVRADSENFFPDIVEQAFHVLDFVASYRPSEHWAIKLKLQNLAMETQDFRQGDVIIKTIDRGLTATLGLGLTY
jgi:hypothetical protein